jgi:hypothetical protein
VYYLFILLHRPVCNIDRTTHFRATIEALMRADASYFLFAPENPLDEDSSTGGGEGSDDEEAYGLGNLFS